MSGSDGAVSLARAFRLSDSAGTTRNLTLLPPETWRTFTRAASREELAAVLDGFVFDAAAPWHEPSAVVTAVQDGPRSAPPRPAPPRPSVPVAGVLRVYADMTGGDPDLARRWAAGELRRLHDTGWLLLDEAGGTVRPGPRTALWREGSPATLRALLHRLPEPQHHGEPPEASGE